MKFTHWHVLTVAALALASFSALSTAASTDPAATSPVAPPAPDLLPRIQALRQSERTQQGSLSKSLHAGTASPADVVAAAQAIQAAQAQRNALEKQEHDQLAQKAAAASSPSGAAAPVAPAAHAPVADAPVPAALLKDASPEQKAAIIARHDLIAQIRALKKKSPDDGKALTDVVSQWQKANAVTLAKAEQATASAATTHRPKILAGLLAAQAKPLPVGDAPPKMKALLAERNAAARDLQIILLQSSTLPAAKRSAALAKWQANHAGLLDQLATNAAAETKALGIAGAAKADRAKGAGTPAIN